MAGKRYSAGRIFLQVVPSFKGFQREVAREVSKTNQTLGEGIEKQSAESSRRAGKKAGSEFLMGFSEWTKADQKRLQRTWQKSLLDLDKMTRQASEQAAAKRKRDIESVERFAQNSTLRLRKVQVAAMREAEADSERFYRENIKQYERVTKAAQKAADERTKIERERMSRIGGAMRKELDKAIKGIDESLRGSDMSTHIGREFDRIRKLAKQTGHEVSNNVIDMTTARRNIESLGRDLERLGRRRGGGTDIDRGNIREATKDIKAMTRAMDDAGRGRGRFSRALSGLTGDGQDGANAFRIFNYRILAVVSALPLLVPVAASAAGGLVALAGAALGVGAAMGVMVLGFSGIGEAVKAYGDVQDNAAKDSLASAKAMRSAGRAVRDAGQGLARARTQAARAAEDSNRRIADAEKRLASAQKDATRAQQELRDARAAAQRDQDALADRIKAGALDERQALIDLFDAQVAYNAAMADGGATKLEKEQLSINLERARLAIKGIRADNADLAQQQKQADQQGVEGSKDVIQAKERVADAAAAQKEAEQGVRDARRDADEQAADSALAIRDATERLTDAQESYNEALAKTGDIGSASQQKLDGALAKLGPEGRAFAAYLFSLRDGFYEIRDAAQKGMLPGVQDAMEQIINRYGPGFTSFVEKMGESLGDAFRLTADAFTSPVWESFFATMDKYAPVFNDDFVQTMLNLATGFAALFDAFAPVSADLSQALVDISGAFAEWAAGLKGSEGLQSFFDYLETTGPKVWDLIKEIVGAFINLGKALAPIADKVLDGFIAFFDMIGDMDPDTLAAIATAVLGFFLASQLAAGATQLLISLMTPFHSVLGAIVFIAIAVGAAFIYAYQHSETFRDIVDSIIGFFRRHQGLFLTIIGIVGSIGTAFFIAYKVLSVFYGKVGAVMKILGFLRYAFALLGGPIGIVIAVIGALVAAFVWAYQNSETFRDIVNAVWAGIVAQATWMWENVLKPIFDFFVAGLEDIAAVAKWMWSIIGPVFELLGAMWDKLWQDVLKPGIDWLSEKFDTLGKIIKLMWDAYIEPTLDKFGLGADDLQRVWKVAIDAIGAAWESLKGLVYKPIEFIVNTVINKGFVDNFNKLADYFGTTKISHLSLPSMDKAVDRKSYSGRSSHGVGGYATGGWTGPGSKYQPAGVVHADEFVIRKESTNRLRAKYGLGALNYINTFGELPGMGGYATGGLVALGKRLQGLGFAVSENPAFGGVNGRHSRTGWHYRGGAIDVNWPNGQRQSAEETQKINAIVGLGKQYGMRVIWQYPGHYDHIHFDIDKGPDLGNFAGAQAGRRSDTPAWIEKPFEFIQTAVNKLMGTLPDNAFMDILKGFPNKILDFAKDKITDLLVGTGDYSGEGDGGASMAGLEQWRPTALAALQRVGQPASLIDLVMRRMAQESGGNPKAINLWDSNALAGIPSKGLMQVIDPTFRTWRDPSLPNDIYNPMSNIVASMRYALNRYGSLESAYGRAGGYADGGLVTESGGLTDNGTMMYDNGGYLPPGVTQVVNLTGRPEPVFTASQFDSMTANGGGGAPLIGELHEHMHGSDLSAGDVTDAIMFRMTSVQHAGKYQR